MSFPIEIGGIRSEVNFWGEEDNKLRFGLFVDNSKYSIKMFEVDENGYVGKDEINIFPDFDKTDHEPNFSSISDNEITLKVMNQILVELIKIRTAQ